MSSKSKEKVSALAKRFDSGNYQCSNKMERYYEGNVYHPAPSSTTLEIKINQQNASPTLSSFSVSPILVHNPQQQRRLPAPSISPPSPPTQEYYANPHYPTKEHASSVKATAPPASPIISSHTPLNGTKTTKRPSFLVQKRSSFAEKSKNMPQTIKYLLLSVMFRVSIVELILSLLIAGSSIWCAIEIDYYCRYHSGILSACLFTINSILGIITARAAIINLYVTHLVLSLISMVVCIVGAILASVNWHNVGREAECAFGTANMKRISYIYTNAHKYDFPKCLFDLKLGVAINSIQLVTDVILFILFLLSAALCIKKTCTRCR